MNTATVTGGGIGQYHPFQWPKLNDIPTSLEPVNLDLMPEKYDDIDILWFGNLQWPSSWRDLT